MARLEDDVFRFAMTFLRVWWRDVACDESAHQCVTARMWCDASFHDAHGGAMPRVTSLRRIELRCALEVVIAPRMMRCRPAGLDGVQVPTTLRIELVCVSVSGFGGVYMAVMACLATACTSSQPDTRNRNLKLVISTLNTSSTCGACTTRYCNYSYYYCY